jgi:hypothetical protein
MFISSILNIAAFSYPLSDVQKCWEAISSSLTILAVELKVPPTFDTTELRELLEKHWTSVKRNGDHKPQHSIYLEEASVSCVR